MGKVVWRGWIGGELVLPCMEAVYSVPQRVLELPRSGFKLSVPLGPVISSQKGGIVNLPRIVLAAVGGFVGYMALGSLMFVALPSLKTEFKKYSAIYRSHEGQMSHMPLGMAAMFVGILVLAFLYAMLYAGGSGLAEGARFGALIGVFAICCFVLHNWVNLNIGLKLALQQSVAYFVEWLAVGIAIGLIYRPLPVH